MIPQTIEYKTPDEIRLRPTADNYVSETFADPYIVCAACRWDGLIIASSRHFSPVMGALMIKLGFDGVNCEQGFIDHLDRFWTRKEALHIMRLTGQKIKDEDMCRSLLYSEGLY